MKFGFLSFIFLFLFALGDVQAQTGPGGVGATDGASSLLIWLQADSVLQTPGGVTSTDGDAVGDWRDQSGFGRHVIQSTMNRPFYRSSGINGVPALEFIGDGDFLDYDFSLGGNTDFLDGLSGVTVFFVVKSDLTNTDKGFFDTEVPDGADDAFSARYDLAGGSSGNRPNVIKSGISTTGGDTQFESSAGIQDAANPQLLVIDWSSGSNLRLFEDGAIDVFDNYGTTNPTGIIRNSTRVTIGRGPKDQAAGDSWDGFIGEVVIYDGRLNDAERIVVQNYLASKFGLTITGIDYYAFEGTHPEDIAGIGQSGADIHAAANSSSLLGISTTGATTLSDGSFLMLGHNGGTSSWNTSELPTTSLGAARRIAREWRIDETVDQGVVKFTIDTDELATPPAGYTKYVLMVDEDGDFTDAASYELTLATGVLYEITIDPTDGQYFSIGVVEPSLGFTAALIDSLESEDVIDIPIFLNYIPITDVQFDVASVDGTATSITSGALPFNTAVDDQDFVEVGLQTITFTASTDQSTIISVDINQDTQGESTESFTLEITNATVGINVVSPIAVRINDDDNDRKIYFNAATSSVDEFTSSISVQVNLTPAFVDASNPTTVDYFISSGSATSPGDFSLVSGGTLTIPANNIAASFDVSIVDDAIDENDETVIIGLTNPVNGNLSDTEPVLHTLTIVDNDPGTLVQFNQSATSGSEGTASPSITVVLSALKGVDVQVDYAISGNTTPVDDYSLNAGTLTIPAGSISTTINPTIIDDAISESDETIVLTLSNAVEANLGANTVHTYTIVDNDAEFGFSGPGGVGSVDGTSALSLWLKADAGTKQVDGTTDVVADGSVAQWEDQSGNVNDFDEISPAENPLLRTSGINGRPALEFDGTNDVLLDDDGENYVNDISAYSLVAVIKSDVINTDKGFFDTDDPLDGQDDQLALRYDDLGVNSGNTDDVIKFGITNGTESQQLESEVNDQTTNPQIIVADWASGSDVRLYIDGLLRNSQVDGPAVTGVLSGADRVIVGTGPKQSGSGTWDGLVGEILMFTTRINNAQRIIFENYLAAKYQIPITNDLYAYEATHGDFVAGIGQFDADEFHDDAQSDGILRINNPSALATGDYLFFGHDATAISSWTLTESPVDSIYRVAREWVLDDTNYSGTIDVILSDPTNTLSAIPAGSQGYVLLVDDNGIFDDGGTTIYEMTASGSDYVYEGLAISGDVYLSFGTIGITADVALTAASVEEASGTYDLAFTLSRASANPTIIDYVINGTSTAVEGGGNDYTLSAAGSITVPPLATSANLTITINDDATVELAETIQVDLTTADNNVFVRPSSTFTLTILDNDASMVTAGPGGISTSNFAFWLSADNGISISNGGAASTDGQVTGYWTDRSTAGNDAIAVSGIDPIFRDNITDNVNQKPVVAFDGSQAMTIADNALINTGGSNFTEKTVVVAFETGVDVTNLQVVYEQGGAGNGLNIHVEDGLVRMAVWASDYTGTYAEVTQSAAPNTRYIATLVFESQSGTDSDLSGYLNSAFISTINIDNGDLNTHGGDIGIGGMINDSRFSGTTAGEAGDGYYFQGKVLELISTNRIFSAAEQNILENYLAGKWNVNISTGTDIYAHKTFHSFDVAGIGRSSATEFIASSSSSAVLTFSNASDLRDNEYLIFGHDNADADTYVAAEIPTANFERLAREWRVSEQGDVGAVKLTIDPAEISGSPSTAEFNQYALLVDADGDFSNGAQVYTLYQNGAVFEASNLQVAEGDYVAIGVFRPTIQFVPASVTGDESISSYDIVIRLAYPVDADVTVDYANNTMLTTATEGGGNDYVLADGTASILRGDTTATVTFSVIDDVDDTEGNELIVVDLSAPSAGLFLDTDVRFEYIIEDNDLLTKVDFAVAATSVGEGNGSINLTLKLNQTTGTDVNVDYTITGGTATEGQDFTLAAGTVTVINGNLTSVLPIPLINDVLDEDDETLIITLSNPVGANLDINKAHTLTILDNDDAPTVQFTSATLSGSEGSTPANLPVNLSSSSGKVITVNYQLSSTTGTQGIDFNFSSGILTFQPGDSLATISLGITDDFELEVDEEVIVELFDGGNLVNTTLGAITQVTYTINDNDAGGFNGPGGVRAASDYVYWFRSDRAVYNNATTDALASDSDIAAEWFDFSGSGNSAIATVSQEPVYRNNGTDNVNNKPAVEFSGNEIMTIADANGVNQNGPFTNKTLVVAYQLGADVATRQVLAAQGGGTNGFAILVASDSLYVTAWNDNNITAIRGAPVTAQTAGVAILEFSDIDVDPGVTDLRLDGYLNGVQLPIRLNGTDVIDDIPLNNHAEMVMGIFNNDQINFLGASQDAYSGKLMEVFSFNGNYASSQRIIIENYLASKYNANITAGGNDYYAYSGQNSFGIAGIGRVSGTDFYPKAQSDSTILISNASNLGDNEYLIWGHNNGSISSYTTTDSPADMIRLARQWRVSESGGDIGTMTFVFDTLQIPAVPAAGFTKYVLLIDADGTFADGAAVIPLTSDGSTYVSNAVNFADGDYFTLGAFSPKVQFDLAASNGTEDQTPATLAISLNYPVVDDLSFDVNQTGGTSTEDADYSYTDDTFLIVAGATTRTVDLAVINDLQVESDETVILTISNPSVGEVGTRSTHTYTINDDDNFRKADFALSAASATEDLTIQSVDVVLNAADPTNPTEIFFTVSGGTAMNDSIDFYVQTVDTVRFAAGVTTETIAINIINDLIDEDDETIVLSLTGGLNATLGTATSFTFTINDQDDPPTVQFTNTARSGSESFQTVELAIELSGVSGKDVTIPYSISGGSATEDVDFQLLASSFTIPAGDLTDSLRLIVIDDGMFESPDEDFLMTLGAPVDGNSTLGTNTTLTYTILDNDGAGIDGPGGIGDLDGQIALWLRANDEVSGFTNGVNVSTWQDVTTNNNDGTQAVANQQPLFLSNLINSRPAIVFDGTNDIIEIASTPDINTGGPYDKKTIFVAFRTGTDVTSRQMIYEEGGGARGLSIYLDQGDLYVSGWNEINDDAGATTPWPSNGSGAPYALFQTFAVTGNTNYFVTMQFDFDLEGGVFNGEVRGGLNGQEPLDIITGAGRLFNHGDPIGIGGKNGGTVYFDNVNGGGTNSFSGNIAEVVVTNFVFNDAQRRIISNYFSSKYDITIAPSIDFFAHDAGYSYDIVGIGRANAGNVHNEARGTGILKISNPADISDGEYLLIGHNNGAVNVWQTTGVPNNDSNNWRKIGRTWRADETGDVGNISIEVINSQFISPPAGFDENYVLLVDDNADFTSGATRFQLVDNGGTFNVDNIDLSGDKFFTIAIAKGSIQFTNSISNLAENAGPALIPIQTNYIVGDDVTVNYTVTGGTATGNGTDYVLANGVAVIAAGTSSTNLNVSLTNDTGIEPDETVIITLSSPSSGTGLGTNTVHTLTINDDDTPRKANFALASVTNAESVLTYDVEITLSQQDAINPTEVFYQVGASSTAVETDDFVFTTPSSVVFAATETSKLVTLTIVNDDSDEVDETIVLQLTSADNASLGTVTTLTYTITDNDDAPTVGFVSTASSGIESVTSSNLQVTLSAVSSKTVTVDYAVNTGASTASPGGVDFNLVSGSLTFLPGDVSESITLNIFDDAIQENDETVQIELSNQINALSITDATTIYTIIDDDGGLGLLGPGGVGRTLTGSQIAFWLKASEQTFSDAGTTAAGNGDEILQWSDLGGQTLDAVDISGTFATVQTPNLVTGVAAANGRTGVNFTLANTEALNIADNDLINTNAAGYNLKTLFAVFQAPATLAGTQVIYEQGGGGNGFNLYLDGTTLRAGAWSSWSFIDVSTTVSANEVITVIFELDETASEIRWFGHGSINGSFTSTTAGMSAVLAAHGGDIGIGGTLNDTQINGVTSAGEGQFFDGVIFEIMSLNERNTNTANRRILLSYAEAEYGIDVGADDVYTFDEGAAPTYNGELIGIGQIDTDNRHLSAQGQGILRITSPQDANNTEFLAIAHNELDIADFNTTEIPASVSSFISRLDREWKVDETNGDIGAMTFYVDTTRIPTLAAGANYVLIIDDDQDGDFTTGTLTYLNLVDRFGTWATANNVDFADGDVFTIGSAINVGSTTGNWYDPNTWLLGSVPSAVDNIEITSPAIVTLDGDVTIEDLTVRTGAGLDLNGFRLTITNSLTVETATDFVAGTGTVEYASTSGNVCVESLTYYNLDISGSGTKTLCGDIVISNDLTINNNPTLDVDGTNNFTITVLGDWINAVNSTFNPQQGQVIFQGTSLQQITKTGTPEQFYDLQLDNVLDLQLGSSINISNTLDFNVDNGLIFTQTHRLDVENNNVNAILNSGPLRYVVTNGGRLQREVAAGSTYNFPVGDATNYSPFVFDFTSGTVTDLDVSVTPSAHPNIETAGDYISRFWSVEPVAGTANYDLLINYVQTDFNGTSEASIKPVKYNTNQIGDGDFVLDVAANTIAWSGLSSFSDVTAGNEVALPVDLLEFTGTYDNGVVSLLWKTASETNNSHFEVYKLLPGEELRFIGEEQGAGNSAEQLDYRFYDRSPALGINYYQLRQYDFDGQYEVFEMIAVDVSLLDIPLQFAVYPNPSSGNAVTLVLSGVQSGVLFDISIVSLQGKEVFRHSLQVSTETFDLNFDQQLSSGIYVIEINYQDQSVIQKLLIR